MTPLATQLSGASFLAANKYALLADDPRVGKTGAAIAELTQGGEAEKAKMQVGDIIVACNGTPLAGPKELGPLLVAGENAFTVIRKVIQMTFKINPVVASY